MSETSSSDLGVWVDDYTTSAGVHVAGHWRKRGSRGITDPVTATTAGAMVTDGPTYAGTKDGTTKNPEGGRSIIATGPDITSGIPAARTGSPAEAPRDKVTAGLEALRRRREALAQKHTTDATLNASTSRSQSSDGETGTGQGSGGGHAEKPDVAQRKCGTCGQFKAAHHTCRAAEGTVVDPTAAEAARRAADRHADTIVTEYVPFSGDTCWSVKGPEGTYLVTPVGGRIGRRDGYLVWKSDSVQGGVRAASIDRGITTGARLASALPTGQPGSDDWDSVVKGELQNLPDGATHTLPAIEGRDGTRYAEALDVTHSETSDGSGVFTITDHDGTITRETYGPDHHHVVGNHDDKAHAAQMATYQAGARQQPARCGACGQYVPLDGTHSCPNPNGTRAAALVRQISQAADDDLGEDEDSANDDETVGDLPTGDYADVKGDDRVKAMLADLEESVKAVVESGRIKDWLDAMASNGMTRWSLNNRILAMLQIYGRQGNLDGMHLMGFRQWEKLNRKVNKGAKAVWILAPRTRTVTEEDDDGQQRKRTIVTGFKAIPVFNISDTSGEPLAEHPSEHASGEVTPGTIEGLRDRVGRAGYTYKEEEIPGYDNGNGTLGYTDPRSKEVVVDPRLSKAQKASTLAHELGHIHCGHVDDLEAYRRHRGRQESEAEMAAYLVNRQRGMTGAQASSFSAGYIAGWAKGDAKVIHAAMDKAVAASNKILEGDWPSS